MFLAIHGASFGKESPLQMEYPVTVISGQGA